MESIKNSQLEDEEEQVPMDDEEMAQSNQDEEVKTIESAKKDKTKSIEKI